MAQEETLKRALDFVAKSTKDVKVKSAAISLVIASASLVAYVTKEEGTENVPYKDIVGVLTVCQGHTGPDIIPDKVYSKEECDLLLKKDLTTHGLGVLKCVKVPINQNQYDAFTSFTFNVGVNAFCTSTLVKKLNEGDYTGACNQLPRWNRAGGKEVRGLTNRRLREKELCLKPISTQDKHIEVV